MKTHNLVAGGRWLRIAFNGRFFCHGGLDGPRGESGAGVLSADAGGADLPGDNSTISGIGSTIQSIFSIIVTGNGTVIYYDQWEDGYETDLSNPTQPTTQIWGDGNDAHGIPPGFAHNPAGDCPPARSSP